MRGIIAAVLAIVTVAAGAEPPLARAGTPLAGAEPPLAGAGTPLAQATLKMHYKGGKNESRRVQLARQPDGAWRFELRTADMPGNAQWIDLVSDAAVRRQGDPGWWMVDDGRWGAFTRSAGKTVVSNMRMPFFGMKTAEGKAWFAIIKGMRCETNDRLEATNGVYRLSTRLKLSSIGFSPYENWVVDFYELDGADATYSGMGRLYRKWQLDRGEVKPLRERVKGNEALAYAAEAFFVRCKFGRCDRTKTTREDWLKAMPPVLVEHTFEDFKDIMRRFKEIGIDKAEMCMVGFQKGGHDGPFPDLFPADDRFGGEKGMRDAIAYGKSLGYRMNCHINQNNFYRNAKRWNIDDVAKDRDGNPLKYTVYPGGQVYRSCWEVCCKKYVDKDIADEKDLGLNGLFHVDVTSAILPGVCHDPKHPNNRKSMREWQLKVGEKVRAAFGGYSSECGIDHCAPMLDNALYVSTFPGWHSQKSELVDGYLPIWHVVYSGIIMSQPFYATIDAPCARGTGSGKTDAVRGSEAVTTYLDTPERRTLKVFELNGRPTFYYTDYKDLRPIKRMYDLWQPLKHLQFEFLDDHAEIAPDVFRSRYSNGEEVVCNYTDKPFFYRGQPVASLAYRLYSAAECACTVVPTSADYPVKEADMTNVTITAGFWLPRFETNRVVTVKADFDKSEETGRLANFREAAKRAKGTFKGCPFDDSDVFKIIEGAAYTLATHPDPELEKYLDKLIADIAGAQEPDGYLYTARTLGMEKVKGFPRAGMMGPERWSNTGASHEFYNMGHMIEAGVAYWQVTGKRQLLDVAIKAADMMDRTFGYGPGQIQRVPGHEEIELALCKLYRATGEVPRQRARLQPEPPARHAARPGVRTRRPRRLPLHGDGGCCGTPRRPVLPRRLRASVEGRGGHEAPPQRRHRRAPPRRRPRLRERGRGVRRAVRPAERERLPRDVRGNRERALERAALPFLRRRQVHGRDRAHHLQRLPLRHLDVRRRVLLPQPARLRRRLRALEVVRLQLLPRERGALHPADRAVRLRDVREHGLREPLRRERREAQPQGRNRETFAGNRLSVERKGQDKSSTRKDSKRTTAREFRAQRAHSGMVRGASRAEHALRADRAERALQLQGEGER